jgi:hypothetical protein
MRRKLRWAAAILILYLLAAYVVLPRIWTHHEHQPGLAAHPAVTQTEQGIPGDPLNVGLVGDRNEILKAMHAAGWHPADPVTLKSSIAIIGSVVFDRPYVEAPVSPLLYEGRKQDLAFEKPIGKSADRRNHVRFWSVLENGAEGRTVWLGSATMDKGVELSRYTGQVTHHVAPDIDDERNRLIGDLAAARMVTRIYNVSGIGPTVAGRNGGGDWYYTDGEIRMAVIPPGAAPFAGTPERVADKPLIALKNGVWASVSEMAGDSGDTQ